MPVTQRLPLICLDTSEGPNITYSPAGRHQREAPAQEPQVRKINGNHEFLRIFRSESRAVRPPGLEKLKNARHVLQKKYYFRIFSHKMNAGNVEISTSR